MLDHEDQDSPQSVESAPAPAACDPFGFSFRLSPTAQVILDPQTLTLMEANLAAAKVLGLREPDLKGRNFVQFMPDEAARKAFRENIPPLAGLGVPTFGEVAEIRLKRPNGYILLAETRCVLFPRADQQAGLLVWLEDVTQRKVAESQQWAESQSAGYQRLVECIGDGFLVLDEEGMVVFANSSAERIMRQPRESLIRRPMLEIFPQFDAKALHAMGRPQRAGEGQGRTFHFQVPVFLQCEMHQFEFSLYPHRDGIGVLFRDISERVKQELEIAKLNATMALSQELLRRKNDELNASLEQLSRLNEQLAQADRLKSEFLANTSHELRTPLNSIIGFLQLISEGLCESREEEIEYIRNTMASGQHLLSLINDVLDIAKIEAGKMTLLIDDISITTIFQEIYNLAHVQAAQKGIELIFEVKDEDHGFIRTDFNKTKQILINLVGNSIKFTNKGSITVQADLDPERSDMVRFSVKDTGIGVPPYRQQAIFEKFVQVDGTTTRKYQGTGLGLAITKNLVEMMGGSIRIYSEGENLGTTMFFTLPLGSSKLARREASEPGSGSAMEIEEALPQTF